VVTRQLAAEIVVLDQGFDYALLGTTQSQIVRAAAARIRVKVKRTIEDIIAVGTDLLTVKESLPYGQFGPWLQAEFGWTNRTAHRFMAVAAWLSARSDIVSDLG